MILYISVHIGLAIKVVTLLHIALKKVVKLLPSILNILTHYGKIKR